MKTIIAISITSLFLTSAYADNYGGSVLPDHSKLEELSFWMKGIVVETVKEGTIMKHKGAEPVLIRGLHGQADGSQIKVYCHWDHRFYHDPAKHLEMATLIMDKP